MNARKLWNALGVIGLGQLAYWSGWWVANCPRTTDAGITLGIVIGSFGILALIVYCETR